MSREGRMIGSMRKTLRVFLWIIKGVLLMIALAALVMWPVSQGRLMGLRGQRYRAETDWAELRECWVGCMDGRAIIGGELLRETGARDAFGFRNQALSGGTGWRWAPYLRAGRWSETSWPDHYGPLHRAFVDRVGWKSSSDVLREFAAPLWLVVLVLGAWPAVSVARTIHHAITRRRAVMAGCCTNCGYDLRVTPTSPADGGDVRAVCPECGNAADGRG